MEKNVTVKSEKLMLAILTEPTLTKAAAMAGVSESTLRRRLNDEDFQREFLMVRRQVFTQAIGRLQAMTRKAVDTLERLLEPSAPAHVQAKAARTVLEQARAGIALDDLEPRLRALEQRLLEEDADGDED